MRNNKQGLGFLAVHKDTPAGVRSMALDLLEASELLKEIADNYDYQFKSQDPRMGYVEIQLSPQQIDPIKDFLKES